MTSKGYQASGRELGFAVTKITPALSWELVNTTRLNFPTHHPRGLVVTDKYFYVSTTEITKAPQPLLQPLTYLHGSERAADGQSRSSKPPLDRSPGQGVPHLLVISKSGALLNDVVLTPRPELVSKEAADCYHAGGIDMCRSTQTIYIPVAQNRPNSHTVIIGFKVDDDAFASKLRICTEVDDYIGAVAVERTSRLRGLSWDSRKFIRIDQDKGLNWRLPWQDSMPAVLNPSHTFALKDMQALDDAGIVVSSGVNKLPGPPQTAKGNPKAEHSELGGIVVMEMGDEALIHESPVSLWRKDGRAMTRNAVWFALVKRWSKEGAEHWLKMWALPNDGSEAKGTPIEIYEFMARVH